MNPPPNGHCKPRQSQSQPWSAFRRAVKRFGMNILQYSNSNFLCQNSPWLKLKHSEINPRPAQVLDTFDFAVLHPRRCTRRIWMEQPFFLMRVYE